MAAPGQRPDAVRATTVAAVILVAVVAGVVSFMHMHELALRAGEVWRAWVIPLAVDGLIVAASMTMLVRRRAGLSPGWLSWVSLLAGIAASLAANIAAAQPTLVGRAVAAWPPVALLLAYELLMDQVKIAGSAAGGTSAGSPPAPFAPAAELAGGVPGQAAGPEGVPQRAGTGLHVAASLPDGELRDAARAHYRQVLASGGSMSGRELGEMFGMSPRWGQLQRAAVEDELTLSRR